MFVVNYLFGCCIICKAIKQQKININFNLCSKNKGWGRREEREAHVMNGVHELQIFRRSYGGETVPFFISPVCAQIIYVYCPNIICLL